MSDSGVTPFPRRRVGPLEFSVTSLAQAAQALYELASNSVGRGVAVHCANAYNIALSETDHEYRALLNGGDIVFCDGVPVVWAGRYLHAEDDIRWSRVYGPDLMQAVFALSDHGQPRHYLLGGSGNTLEALERELTRQWPSAVIAGSESPTFGQWTSDQVAKRDERIVASGANIVWVGLGTPKQDFEVARIAASLPVVAVAVGAAFDFLAGTKQQAPVWMQRSGLEWFFRLTREPRRLSRRYLWGNPVFVYAVAKQRFLAQRGRTPRNA